MGLCSPAICCLGQNRSTSKVRTGPSATLDIDAPPPIFRKRHVSSWGSMSRFSRPDDADMIRSIFEFPDDKDDVPLEQTHQLKHIRTRLSKQLLTTTLECKRGPQSGHNLVTNISSRRAASLQLNDHRRADTLSRADSYDHDARSLASYGGSGFGDLGDIDMSMTLCSGSPQKSFSPEDSSFLSDYKPIAIGEARHVVYHSRNQSEINVQSLRSRKSEVATLPPPRKIEYSVRRRNSLSTLHDLVHADAKLAEWRRVSRSSIPTMPATPRLVARRLSSIVDLADRRASWRLSSAREFPIHELPRSSSLLDSTLLDAPERFVATSNIISARWLRSQGLRLATTVSEPDEDIPDIYQTKAREVVHFDDPNFGGVDGSAADVVIANNEISTALKLASYNASEIVSQLGFQTTEAPLDQDPDGSTSMDKTIADVADEAYDYQHLRLSLSVHSSLSSMAPTLEASTRSDQQVLTAREETAISANRPSKKDEMSSAPDGSEHTNRQDIEGSSTSLDQDHVQRSCQVIGSVLSDVSVDELGNMLSGITISQPANALSDQFLSCITTEHIQASGPKTARRLTVDSRLSQSEPPSYQQREFQVLSIPARFPRNHRAVSMPPLSSRFTEDLEHHPAKKHAVKSRKSIKPRHLTIPLQVLGLRKTRSGSYDGVRDSHNYTLDSPYLHEAVREKDSTRKKHDFGYFFTDRQHVSMSNRPRENPINESLVIPITPQEGPSPGTTQYLVDSTETESIYKLHTTSGKGPTTIRGRTIDEHPIIVDHGGVQGERIPKRFSSLQTRKTLLGTLPERSRSRGKSSEKAESNTTKEAQAQFSAPAIFVTKHDPDMQIVGECVLSIQESPIAANVERQLKQDIYQSSSTLTASATATRISHQHPPSKWSSSASSSPDLAPRPIRDISLTKHAIGRVASSGRAKFQKMPPRAWARFSSHDRDERNATAGIEDGVIGRDFVVISGLTTPPLPERNPKRLISIQDSNAAGSVSSTSPIMPLLKHSITQSQSQKHLSLPARLGQIGSRVRASLNAFRASSAGNQEASSGRRTSTNPAGPSMYPDLQLLRLETSSSVGEDDVANSLETMQAEIDQTLRRREREQRRVVWSDGGSDVDFGDAAGSLVRCSDRGHNIKI